MINPSPFPGTNQRWQSKERQHAEPVLNLGNSPFESADGERMSEAPSGERARLPLQDDADVIAALGAWNSQPTHETLANLLEAGAHFWYAEGLEDGEAHWLAVRIAGIEGPATH